MRKLTFYGSSDDLFEIRGTTRQEPCEAASLDGPAVAKIEAREGCVCVVAVYAPKGSGAPCWALGLMPVAEDVPIPPWPVTFRLHEIRPGGGYSAELTVTVPDDAVVSMVSP